MTSDGAGNLIGKVDENDAGSPAEDTAFTGTYHLSDNGRVDITINEGACTAQYAFYLVSGRTGFRVPTDSGSAAILGFIYRQF